MCRARGTQIAISTAEANTEWVQSVLHPPAKPEPAPVSFRATEAVRIAHVALSTAQANLEAAEATDQISRWPNQLTQTPISFGDLK